jgi:hypothetical protein
MNALIWRLHHRQVWFALAALAALGVLLAITGIVMANDYSSFMASCGATNSCGDASSVLFRGDGAIMDVVDATLVVPLLFGIFWGAPLLAKEYEDGTQSLAWTQRVTRRRWMNANVQWVFAAAVVWAAAMAALVSWWRGPENAIDNRFSTFDIQGIVPVAYAVFAVALGIATGSLIKRVLPAIATTFGVFVAVRALIGVYLRPHFMTPVTKILPLTSLATGGPPGAWVLSNGVLGPGGRPVPVPIPFADIPSACRAGIAAAGPDSLKLTSVRCLAAHGFHETVTYQPAGRFWAFQGMEAAIFVVLAALLVLVAYRVVLSRDA